MAKYRIPITVTTYTVVDADNLADAIADVNKGGDPDIEGVHPGLIDYWEISGDDPIFKDGKEIVDKDNYCICLEDINENKLNRY